MEKSLARPAGDVERVVHTYGNMLFRLCLITLGSASDAEDVIQETMITYLRKKPEFKDAEHEKAWLITVATNKCKDLLRFRVRHPMIDLEQIQEFAAEDSDSGILEALMTLPEKFRIVLILYYVEEYRIEEIAKMIGKTPSAVKMRLQKGRSLLGKVYRKEYM
ncbi:MAG: RNA polymerase sigma factor [Lachnospiraceae bacterium]|nr:RNA polymerase sigma factor [Lachnospiraceae bacterium]